MQTCTNASEVVVAIKKTIEEMTDEELIEWVALAPHMHSTLEVALAHRLEARLSLCSQLLAAAREVAE